MDDDDDNNNKLFFVIFSRDHCQRSSPSWISDTLRAGSEPLRKLSSDFVEWSWAAVITTTPRRHNYKRIIKFLITIIWIINFSLSWKVLHFRLTTNVPIIYKPVNWFVLQINWLISVWSGRLVVNGLSVTFQIKFYIS